MVILFGIVIAVGVLIAWLACNHWIARLLMFLLLAPILSPVCALLFQSGGSDPIAGAILGILASFVIIWIPKWYRAAQSPDASLEISLAHDCRRDAAERRYTSALLLSTKGPHPRWSELTPQDQREWYV